MASDDFRFKQFTVRHDRCAMKVGTDGVLLGVWADIAKAETILDIGTGSGLVALICSQRSNAKITAIEIDESAAVQASENAADSQWKDRITIMHSSLDAFALSSKQLFDVIVSNPPYFENSYKAKGDRRNLARHADTLPLDGLVRHAASLLSASGIFSCILPVQEDILFEERARSAGLFLKRKTMVLPREGAGPKRVMFEFTKRRTEEPGVTFLAILKKETNDVTDEYREMTKEFYLNF
jgi:tRNA1Val (adenine37-N6)-methyltransferase